MYTGVYDDLKFSVDKLHFCAKKFPGGMAEAETLDNIH